MAALAEGFRAPGGPPGFEGGLALRELLDALDGARREAFVLTQLVGMPHADAAAVVGCPIGTVRSRWPGPAPTSPAG
ncbi:sigma factor-like helix-turn-helix DNA-binding protein [Streptomyces sp. NPDC048595]|uniref:sigma factor-like helix-turn-helix DNA-binding protein n=1 Tax=Streptomyces sp. NPDC048595 TaxID=3365576 RepID=UPI003722610D